MLCAFSSKVSKRPLPCSREGLASSFQFCTIYFQLLNEFSFNKIAWVYPMGSGSGTTVVPMA